MKIVTIQGWLLLHWCTKFHIDISSRLWIIEVWNVENRTRTRTHTHTSGRQLKIIFFEVLDYSEFSDTNISNFFFHEKIASWVRKQNGTSINFRHFSLFHFTFEWSLYFPFPCSSIFYWAIQYYYIILYINYKNEARWPSVFPKDQRTWYQRKASSLGAHQILARSAEWFLRYKSLNFLKF